MQVGIIGSGYAARQRVAALQADERVKVVAIAGPRAEQVHSLAESCGAMSLLNGTALLQIPQVELVFICTINSEHGDMVQAALETGKHVVVEYPLSLNLEQARYLVAYARSRRLLLHVEHIELLSGVHLLLRREVPKLGSVFMINYTTITANRPAPERWTYQPDLFGFPLWGAVSRLHRLIDLWGAIDQVFCQVRYTGSALPERFHSCYSVAHLRFASGILATVSYGKGESFWRSQRTLDIQGSLGGLFIDDDQAVLVQGTEAQPLETGSRLGLFAQDTRIVLDHLCAQHPLYIQSEQVLHTLAVAHAAQVSAHTGETVRVHEDQIG